MASISFASAAAVRFFVPNTFLGGPAKAEWGFVVASSGADVTGRYDLVKLAGLKPDAPMDPLFIMRSAPGRTANTFGGVDEADPTPPALVDVLVPPGGSQLRLRAAVSGGAALPLPVARVFVALGVPILQGYGLTETSPVLSVNLPEDNIPASVGVALRGTELRIGADDELLARGPGVMLGYWNNHVATKQMIDADGWLRTGDLAEIRDGFCGTCGMMLPRHDVGRVSAGERVFCPGCARIVVG